MQVRDELERGATSIVLDVRTNALLDGALDGVQLELVTLVLDAGPQWATAAGTLADLWSRRGLAPDAAAAVLGADPVGEWAASGGGVDLGALDGGHRALGACGQRSAPPRHDRRRRRGPRVHEAGGGEVDELAYALALGVHYLRTLTGSGLDVDAAARQLEFRFAAAPDQFLTIGQAAGGPPDVASRRQRQRRRRHPAATACRDVTRRHGAL